MSKRITPDQFDWEWFRQLKVQKRKKGNQGSRRKVDYLDLITAFDIETSKIIYGYEYDEKLEKKKPKYQSFMYVWMYQFGTEYTVFGRTWDEYLDFIHKISSILGDTKLVTFVHNLSYEFQFQKGIYDFMMEDVFALDKRKVLKCELLNNIEQRCSWLHSNMSLDAYTKKMGAEHVKKSGEDFDYSIVRYPWTELSELEYEYCTNDVLGLVEAIQIEMDHDDDNLYTYPLTSTGYVRRDAKRAMRQVSHSFVRNQLPDLETYEMLSEAFRGGDTHANRYYVNKVLNNVKSADEGSAYPAMMCNKQFPCSKFMHIGPTTFDNLIKIVNVRKKAVVMRVSITNLRPIDNYYGAPYLPISKCRQIRKPLIDNGRIISAEYLETTITDIDLKIILDEYDFDDFVPMHVAHARYGKLPDAFKNTIIQYYQDKTALKDMEGQELYYMKSKNKLNSLYGMAVQNPVKQSINYINGEFIEAEDDPQELLDKFNKRAFLPYQWGVWTTAHARYALKQGIKMAGDGHVYNDTDSVYYLNEVDWSIYNNRVIKESKESGAYAKDPKGNIHYMGVFEEEGSYFEFATLGAKKYVTRKKPDSELVTTIAGVAKRDKNGRKSGGQELDDKGGIKAFKAGFTFKEAGGMDAIYNDNPEISEWVVDGKTIPITSNVVLNEGVYTLGITADYDRLLEMSVKELDLRLK